MINISWYNNLRYNDIANKFTILLIALSLFLGCTETRDSMGDLSQLGATYNFDVEPIKSVSGRGKYLIITLDSIEECVAAKLEQKQDTKHLTYYCLEHYIDKKWVVFYRGDEHNLSKKIFHKPISTSMVRVHFVKAQKMPDIDRFTIYKRRDNSTIRAMQYH